MVVLFFAFKESEKRAEEERIRSENIMAGNPLLNSATGHKVKRRSVCFLNLKLHILLSC